MICIHQCDLLKELLFDKSKFLYSYTINISTYLNLNKCPLFLYSSTIGFGDVLPNHPKKFIFTSLYIFLGLSLLSSGFTILQDLLEVSSAIAKWSMLQYIIIIILQ